jgi:hypothetical protein
MRELQKVYNRKDPKPSELYLGALYTGNLSTKWIITAKNYIKEAIEQLERRVDIKI